MTYVLRDILIVLGLRTRPLGRMADRQIDDPLMEERVLRFQAQIVAAHTLIAILRENGISHRYNTTDLLDLVELAFHHRLIGGTARRCLLDINSAANEAKHRLDFRSRM